MKKLLFILMSVAALLGWSTVSAQDYSAEFKDAEGAKGAFGEQNFTLDGKAWYATCGYYDKTGEHFRLGRREKDAESAKPVDSKFTTLGISEQGAVLEMKWDFENITSFQIVSSYNWEANNKVTLLVSTDEGATYTIVKTETIDVKDPSNEIVERVFSDETAREKARYALALEGEKAGVCRLNLTKVSTNEEVEGDTKAPEIKSVLTTNATTVEVLFNEALDAASAETIANYAVNNDITVSAAKLGEDNKTVTLTTSAMTEGTTYELTVNGVKDAAGNATQNLKAVFAFGAVEVENIAALVAMRDTYIEGQKYRVKGEVVVTALIGKFGKQKNTTNAWIQDKGCEKSKGHSMMLYYVNDLLKDAKVGDVLSGLTGELTVYNDLIEMQNFDTEAIEIKGTADITVDDVTIADLSGADKWLYQNAMVRVKGVKFGQEAGETFAEDKSYNITDDKTTIAIYTNREGSYLGTKVPLTKCDITAYVGYHNAAQLGLRTKEDIVASSDNTAVENNEAIRFSVYPNPTDGMLNVELAEGGQFSLFVYNMNGLQLMRHDGLVDNARVDLSGLAHGMYIVELRTAEGVVRTKVVVR